MSGLARRALVAASLLTTLLALPAHASRVHLPLAARGGPPAVPSDPGAPPVGGRWSAVLADVPVPVDAVLAFFEMRADAEPALAVAKYTVDSLPVGVLGAWYRDGLAGAGWRLVAVSAGSQVWQRDGQQLRLDLPVGGPDGRWLRLTRDAGGARPTGGRCLAMDVPLPAAAVRWRFDRSDLLAEEVHLALPLDAAREAVDRVLAAAGWRSGQAVRLAGATVARYTGGPTPLLVSFREATPERTEVGLGDLDCLAAVTRAAWAESVYLEAVPAPADSEISGYARDAPDGSTERWRAGCHDLDLMLAEATAAWAARDWVMPLPERRRGPGSLRLVGQPGDGPAVTLEARALPAGQVEVLLTRPAAGRRAASGRSLLFADLPLPAGADAREFVHDPRGAWTWRETYDVLPAAPALLAWFRQPMAAFGWRHERTFQDDTGPAAVYSSAGEELLLTAPGTDGTRVEIRRRRVCSSGEPVPVPAEGGRARHLAEMPVFPGAAYDGFEAPVERYRVQCTSLDQLGAWYRAALERGNWVLAMVVGPEDPLERTLVFVRPEERSLPPERRSARAEVVLERAWPFQFVLHHSRDAAGVRPGSDLR